MIFGVRNGASKVCHSEFADVLCIFRHNCLSKRCSKGLLFAPVLLCPRNGGVLATRVVGRISIYRLECGCEPTISTNKKNLIPGTWWETSARSLITPRTAFTTTKLEQYIRATYVGRRYSLVQLGAGLWAARSTLDRGPQSPQPHRTCKTPTTPSTSTIPTPVLVLLVTWYSLVY